MTGADGPAPDSDTDGPEDRDDGPDDRDDVVGPSTGERCPRCDAPVVRKTVLGPHAHVLAPCGCRVAGVDR